MRRFSAVFIATSCLCVILVLAGCGGGRSTNSTASLSRSEVAEAVQLYRRWKTLSAEAEEGATAAESIAGRPGGRAMRATAGELKARAAAVWNEILAFSYPVQEAMADQLRTERGQ